MSKRRFRSSFVRPLGITSLALAAFAGPLTAAISAPLDNTIPQAAEQTGNHTIQQATELLKKGQGEKAIEMVKPLADKEDPLALLLIGIAYRGMGGVTADPEKALGFLRRAAKAGNEDAPYQMVEVLLKQNTDTSKAEAKTLLQETTKKQPARGNFVLGEALLRGVFDGKPDFDQAAQAWNRSADAGNKDTLLALGRLYDGVFGFADKRDAKKALEFFTKAANGGSAEAMVATGSRLLNGEESLRNPAEGKKWLNKAIEQKRYEAYLVLGDSDEKADKQKEAFANYSKGAEAGESNCMIRLGDMLIAGKGTDKKDETKGIEWIRKAATAGNAGAHVRAAQYFLSREKPDIANGYPHLVSAANAGIPAAQNDLALLYLAGSLGANDASAAAAWFGRAAANGHPSAQTNLATLYERGMGVQQDFAKAGQLYELAARQGSPQAAAGIGRLFANGTGTKQDLPRAWAFLSLAVEAGDANAKAALGEVTTMLTGEQINDARKILEDLKKPAPAKTGDASKAEAKPGADKGTKPKNP